MRIAILGWGSLIPCPGELSIRGGWNLDGPILRIEFSRKSSDGRLTLVIDAARGSEVTTQYAESTFENLHESVENLRRREGTTQENIGVCSRRAGETRVKNHREVIPVITEWLVQSRFDAVIWTDLTGQFGPASRTEFLESAFNYLDGLPEICKANARDYINRAPQQTQTALRRDLKSKGWL